MNKDLQIAKKTVQIEIQALKKLSASFSRLSHFSKAVNLLSKINGKCLVVGVGKVILLALKFLQLYLAWVLQALLSLLTIYNMEV